MCPRQVRDYGDDRDQNQPARKEKPEQSEDEPAPVIVARRPRQNRQTVPGLGIHGEPTKLLTEEPTRKTDAPATADGPTVVIAAQSARARRCDGKNGRTAFAHAAA